MKVRLLIVLMLLWPISVQVAQAKLDNQNIGYVQKFLPRTGQVRCYDANGVALDYKESGQDCEQQRGVVWPVPRFLVNDDGTVVDKLTGFTWLKNGRCFTGLTWLGATKKISVLNQHLTGICRGYKGNYEDWIMPNVQDLATLLDAEEAVPADYLRAKGGGDVQSSPYWTATDYQNLFNAWTVDFGNGEVVFHEKMEKLALLPMRRPRSDNGGDDRQLASDAVTDPSRPAQRFIKGNGTVTDQQTGLMWLRDPGCFASLTWARALAQVKKFNLDSSPSCQMYKGRYHDWVLPNRVELMSLVNYNRDYPALYPDMAGANSGGKYWSSTTVSETPSQAFTVNFNNGWQSFSLKDAKLKLMPVRRLDLSPLPARRKSEKAAGNLTIDPSHILALAPELHQDIIWPPPPRFLDNGDGSSMDRMTGVNWLKDGNCFGRKSWQEALEVISDFNSNSSAYKCKGYDALSGDWQMPSIDDLKGLVNPAQEDSAAWLNKQGVSNVQFGGDYWSTSETLINLYYTKVLRFKGQGEIRAFPKSLKFFVWPRRALPDVAGRKPLLNLTVNATSDSFVLTPEYPISLVVFLHSFGLHFPADFWLWYETPDGKLLWLSDTRGWRDKESPVYQGALFNLKNYEIFRSPSANDLGVGEYTFHFAVDATLDGKLDKSRYESTVTVTIK